MQSRCSFLGMHRSLGRGPGPGLPWLSAWQVNLFLGSAFGSTTWGHGGAVFDGGGSSADLDLIHRGIHDGPSDAEGWWDGGRCLGLERIVRSAAVSPVELQYWSSLRNGSIYSPSSRRRSLSISGSSSGRAVEVEVRVPTDRSDEILNEASATVNLATLYSSLRCLASSWTVSATRLVFSTSSAAWITRSTTSRLRGSAGMSGVSQPSGLERHTYLGVSPKDSPVVAMGVLHLRQCTIPSKRWLTGFCSAIVMGTGPPALL